MCTGRVLTLPPPLRPEKCRTSDRGTGIASVCGWPAPWRALASSPFYQCLPPEVAPTYSGATSPAMGGIATPHPRWGGGKMAPSEGVIFTPGFGSPNWGSSRPVRCRFTPEGSRDPSKFCIFAENAKPRFGIRDSGIAGFFDPL